MVNRWDGQTTWEREHGIGDALFLPCFAFPSVIWSTAQTGLLMTLGNTSWFMDNVLENRNTSPPSQLGQGVKSRVRSSGPRQMAPLAALQKDPCSSPPPTRRLTTNSNFSSRGSDTLLWPPRTRYTDIHTGKRPMYIRKRKKGKAVPECYTERNEMPGKTKLWGTNTMSWRKY